MANPTDLRDYLTSAYDDEDFATLCSDYFRNVAENFTADTARGQRVQLLLDYCLHRNAIPDLLAALERDRPVQYRRRFGAPVAAARPEPSQPVRNARQAFISHAHEDTQLAHRLAADLQANGWRVWIAPDNIQPGEKWVEAIERGLEESGAFVLLLTPAAVRSRWVKTEAALAIDLEHQDILHFVPVQVETCHPPLVWGAYQRVPFTGEYGAGLTALLRVLHAPDSGASQTQESLPGQVGTPEPEAIQSLRANLLNPNPATRAEATRALGRLTAQLLREAATKTHDFGGDGAPTATVLVQAIVNEGLKNVAAGANPVLLKRGIEEGAAAVAAAVKAQAIAITTKEEIAAVAAISVHDQEIGNLIAEVMENVGTDGVITVEDAIGMQFEIEYVEGMQFDRGYLSPYFVTNPEARDAQISNPYILITDKKVSAAAEILPLMEKLGQLGRHRLVIIAEDVDREALATLVRNKQRGVFDCLAVKAPGFGDRRKAMLQDIAVLTGSAVITEELGRKLETAMISDLGQADKVIADKDTTTIVGGKGTTWAIKGRIEQIRVEIENSTSDYDRDKLQERLARLAGGVAIIRAGADTEDGLRARKHRVQVALSAVRAAVDEGIVPGGGVALLNSLEALDAVEKGLTGDVLTGVKLLRRALPQPMMMLAESAGYDGAKVVEEVKRAQKMQRNHRIGFDARGKHGVYYTDMVERDMIDPAKIIRGEFENAASIAAMILAV